MNPSAAPLIDALCLMRAEGCDLACWHYAQGVSGQRVVAWGHPVEPWVEQAARAWFEAPYAHLPRITGRDEHASKQTAQALSTQGGVLAGFLQKGRIGASLDRLRLCGDQWVLEAYDFAGSPRSSHKERIALQVWLLREVCQIEVSAITLYLPDKHFCYGGLQIEWDAFFRPYNLMRSVQGRLVRIQKAIDRLLAPPPPPAISPISPRCLSPVRCDFYGACFAHLPKHSVLALARVDSMRRFELLSKGFLTPSDIPDREPLGGYVHIQVSSEKHNRPRIKADAIADYLLDFSYPLYFLDFETVQHAVPPFAGLSPFEPLPFEFSLHILRAPGEAPVHHSLVIPHGEDGRKRMAAQLVALIGPSGRLVAYGADYERRMLRKLGGWSPALRPLLESMAKRTLDLMLPFEKRWCYHPAMLGSCSLKMVAPALDPALDYTALAISDGRDAMEAYLRLGQMAPDEAAATIAALEAYGELDSLAMVRIFERLEALAMSALLEEAL